jgi:hypothetical protein
MAEPLVPLRIDERHDPLLNQMARPFSVQFRPAEERMHTEKKRLARERLTMSKMIGMYCSSHHDSTGVFLCSACQEFLDYAEARLQKCPYGEDKPTCANCPIHCYKPARRAQAAKIMRFAGPRMLLRHPLLAIAHQLDSFRKARHPRELTREQRLHSRKW